jgi:hypothetical protein
MAGPTPGASRCPGGKAPLKLSGRAADDLGMVHHTSQRPATTPGIRSWVKPYGNAISRPGRVWSLVGKVSTTRVCR